MKTNEIYIYTVLQQRLYAKLLRDYAITWNQIYNNQVLH